MSGCVSSSSGFPPGVILCTFVAFEGLCLAFYCVTNLNLVHCEENHKNRYSCILKRYFAQHFWYNIYIVQFRVFHTCVGYSFVCMCVCVCVCVRVYYWPTYLCITFSFPHLALDPLNPPAGWGGYMVCRLTFLQHGVCVFYFGLFFLSKMHTFSLCVGFTVSHNATCRARSQELVTNWSLGKYKRKHLLCKFSINSLNRLTSDIDISWTRSLPGVWVMLITGYTYFPFVDKAIQIGLTPWTILWTLFLLSIDSVVFRKWSLNN
jgi:hypothetical protein